jgi:hypothetical protein
MIPHLTEDAWNGDKIINNHTELPTSDNIYLFDFLLPQIIYLIAKFTSKGDYYEFSGSSCIVIQR